MSDLCITNIDLRPVNFYCARKLPSHSWEFSIYPLDKNKIYRYIRVAFKIDNFCNSVHKARMDLIDQEKCIIRYNFKNIISIMDSFKYIKNKDSIFCSIVVEGIDMFLSILSGDGRFSRGAGNNILKYYEPVDFTFSWGGLLEFISLCIYNIGCFVSAGADSEGINVGYCNDSFIDIIDGGGVG